MYKDSTPPHVSRPKTLHSGGALSFRVIDVCKILETGFFLFFFFSVNVTPGLSSMPGKRVSNEMRVSRILQTSVYRK